MAATYNKFFQFFGRNSQFIRRLSNYPSVSEVLREGVTEKETTVKGWVTSVRKMKQVVFVDVDDGSSAKCLQVVFPKERRPEGLTNGSSIEAAGKVSATAGGQLELHAQTVRVVGATDALKFPFSAKQKHTHDYCRQYLPFRPKLPHFKAMLRVRHRTLQAIHNWFGEQGFLQVDTPILTGNDCEGAGEVFQVAPASKNLIKEMKKDGQSDADAFFGNPAYLSVSGQLHLEAVARSFSKVYSVSPTFRAENSKSRLHLSEFYMLECEEAFVSDLDAILDTIEALVRQVTIRLVTECRQDLEIICKYDDVEFERHLSHLQNLAGSSFVRMSFAEAWDVVGGTATRGGLSKEQELALTQHCGNKPVFVVDWPRALKPFYMKSTPGNPELVSAVDFLVPNIGELCGGSLREDNAEVLESRLAELDVGLGPALQWYVDLRRFGGVPTGGFGMGLERFLQLVTGITNIKDTIPFPRWPHSLKM